MKINEYMWTTETLEFSPEVRYIQQLLRYRSRERVIFYIPVQKQKGGNKGISREGATTENMRKHSGTKLPPARNKKAYKSCKGRFPRTSSSPER